jgi:hypothetical protein
MKFKQLTILRVPEEIQAATGYAARIFAAFEDAPDTGIPLTADLGGQPLEGLGVVQSLEPMLRGYLKTPPQVGDELVIRIGSVEIPTGLTVDDPEIFA